MPGTLAAYGHSWVAGEGASDSERGCVEVTASLLGMTSLNLGVGGFSSEDTAQLVCRQGARPADAYLVIVGLNDARRYGTDPAAMHAYVRALTVVVDRCVAASSHAWVLLVEQPPLVRYDRYPPHDQGSSSALDAYNGLLRRVAAQQPHSVSVTVRGWDARSMLADDTVHPNDLGHQTIAVAVARAYQLASMQTTSPAQD
jgi:lysophospholipase L1-like esterase